jgi:hypothetical protein
MSYRLVCPHGVFTFRHYAAAVRMRHVLGGHIINVSDSTGR